MSAGGLARGFVFGDGEAEAEGFAVCDVLVKNGVEGEACVAYVVKDLGGQAGASLDLVEQDGGVQVLEVRATSTTVSKNSSVLAISGGDGRVGTTTAARVLWVIWPAGRR